MHKKRRETRLYVAAEMSEIKALRRKIQCNENAVRVAESLAFAFNTTNEMFVYSERSSVKNGQIEEENNQYRQRIAEMEIIKKQKMKELREIRAKRT